MGRTLFLLFAALLCCSPPAGASAQGCLPGLASLGGWSCAPVHKANSSVDSKLGYLGYNQDFAFYLAATGALIGNVVNIRYQYPVEGLWIGASVAASGPQRAFVAYGDGEDFCLSLAASWLFPKNKEATESLFVGPRPGTAVRTWQPRTQWYTLDASISRCSWGTFSLMGGFRYDSFSTSFSAPCSVLGTLLVTFTAGEAELVLSNYIPYVGAVAQWGGAKAGVLGFPWAFGSVLSRETFDGRGRLEGTASYRNAYLLETFLELGRKMGVVHLSGFATYTLFHATGDAVVSSNLIGGGSTSGQYTFGFDRQNWIVGGKAVIGFNSPL
jgi:hypothetical protein